MYHIYSVGGAPVEDHCAGVNACARFVFLKNSQEITKHLGGGGISKEEAEFITMLRNEGFMKSISWHIRLAL